MKKLIKNFTLFIMINYKNYLLEIKTIYDESDNNFKKYTEIFFNSWFTKLNKIDLNLLSELCFFLIIRIKKLFNINSQDLFNQFTKNNNKDIKAITLLFLPFINEDNTNIYDKIINLDELVCSKPLNESAIELERNIILKEHFKYSNIGVGLLLENCKFEDELIYKIICNKFLSLLKTLSIINGKMYVNWLNISPLTLETYKTSYIFNETSKNLQNTIKLYFNGDYDLNYNGLYVGEFYNVYRNIYYENIKKIKWIIFPFNINNKKQYLLQFINNNLNLNLILEYKSIDELPYSIQIEFINKLKALSINKNEYILWKNFIVFMVNNFTDRLLIFEEGSVDFKKLKKIFTINNIENEDIDSDYTDETIEKLADIQNYQIDIFLKNVNPKFLWNFIDESLINFKNTMYYDYLIENNKIKTDFYEFESCNLKNLYNIAKTLSHSKKWELLPEKYESLFDDDKKTFWDKYNLNNFNWLNIKKNLNIEFGYEISNIEYNNINNNILRSWGKIKETLVWEYLVKNGILNEFIISNNFIENYKKHPEWLDAYYFVTNKKFSELNKIVNKNYEEIDYFKHLEKELKWYSFYAMDWICQINFFNHYINHRVLFVTGATGQGKSTQVPKLLMYSVKMLDYKTNGKLVCTQPRINVTVGNSARIAEEMGVQIQKPNKKFGKIKTDDYYLQYKYSVDNHIKKTCSHLTLKVSTDGSLFQELIKNGLLKEQIYNKNKDTYIYGNKNIYDVIIIDESHEHNVYMDLLTTIIRNGIIFNNDVKFVIMSATLEEDEPIYRRYFRFINDNLIYPIIKPTLIPFKNNVKINIDRVYLDRRFHISPPGETTQHKITEKYLEESIVDETKPDKLNSDITLKKSYEIILKICNESQRGEILLFANGVKDIMNSVEYLNKVLPEGNIALPYLSEINERYKDIILNIDKTIGFIKSKRSNVHKTWSTEYIEENVSPGTYKRAIIIATNVAEASLTLPSLRYVVETGYTKTNIYNENIDIYSFEIEKISEASRKQRKGRVGRTAEGTVYYVYEKFARELIKPKFKISQINFEDTFLQLIKKDKEIIFNNEYNIVDEYDEEKDVKEGLIVPYYIDPNDFDNYNLVYPELIKLSSNKNISKIVIFDKILNKETDIVKKNILNILTKQYNIKNINYESYWNSLYFNEMKGTRLHFFKRYNTGYNTDNLLDIRGEFYLIHPYEVAIKRNILNEIISFNSKKKNELDPTIYKKMIDMLTQKMILVDINKKKFDANTIKYDRTTFYVCEIYNFVSEIKESLNFIETNKEAFVIIASMGYNCLNEVIGVMTLIKTINSSMKNLFIKIDKSYNDQDRELELLIDIFNGFKKKFYYFNVFKISSIDYLIKKYYSLFIKIVETFLTYYKNDKKNIPKEFNLELWNLLITYYNNNKIYDVKCFENLLNIKCLLTDEIFNDFIKYNNEITQWCNENNLQPKIIIKFVEDYTKNIFDVLTIKRNGDSKYTEPNIIDIMKKFQPSFTKTLESDSIYEKVIKSFMFGYPYQFTFKMKNELFHTTVGGYRIINMDTKINDSPHLFYISYDNAQEYNFNKNNIPYSNSKLEMRITNRIKIEWLCLIMPLFYNSLYFKTLYVNNDDNIITIKEHTGNYYERFINKIANVYNNTILFDNVDKTEYPILHYYVKIIKQFIKN